MQDRIGPGDRGADSTNADFVHWVQMLGHTRANRLASVLRGLAVLFALAG